MLFRKLFLLLLLFPAFCFSQKPGTLPLKTILDQIAAQHETRFSYIDEELFVYMLLPPPQSNSLAQKLSYIEKNTRLRFRRISDNYYSIYNDRRMDKPLCGYLRDVNSGDPIENAQLTIEGGEFSTNSDEEGYFEIALLTPKMILIRHQSYEYLTIDPHDLYVADCPIISLKPIVQPLAEVISHRYLASGISRTDAGAIVIRPNKFGILPGLTEADVLQTMQQIPGVASVDESIAHINVRGGTHDQNLFLWNGIRMYQTGHFFGMLSAFNPLQPTKITVYKNGSPPFFGESVSSLVEISTHAPVPPQSNHVMQLDMISAAFLSNIRLGDKAALQLSGRRTFSDIFKSPTFKNYEDRVFQNTIITDNQIETSSVKSDQSFYFYDMAIQYQQLLGTKHQVIIDAIAIENAADFNQLASVTNNHSSVAQRSFGGAVIFKSTWSAKHNTTFNAALSYYDLNSYNEAVESDQRTNQHNAVFDRRFDIRHAMRATNLSLITVGYEFSEISVENEDIVNMPAFERNSKLISRSHALVGEYHYESESKRTNLRAGVRGNYFQKYSRLRIEPRVQFSQKLSEMITVEIAGEQKSQTLSQIIEQHRDFLGVEKRRWTLANGEDIPVQESVQASAGLTFTDRRWLITAEGFYKKVDGITGHSQGFQNQFEFLSAIGSNTTIGGELLLQRSFKKFYCWISYTYNDNVNRFPTFTPNEFRSNFDVTHTASFAAIYEWNKIRIAIGSKWHSGRPVTIPESYQIDSNNPLNSEITYGKPNGKTLEPYWQVNFSASKTWRFGKAQSLLISGAVLNIFDSRNTLNRFYRIDNANTGIEEVNTFSLGVTPNLSVRYEF